MKQKKPARNDERWDDVTDERIPKDEGWAWFVLLGATLVMLLQLGVIKSGGILFVAFQEKFHSSSSVTSLLSTVQNFCQSITAFLVMTCGIKVASYRNLVFVGSTVSCVAYIITSQARDIRVLLFSHGIVQGVGVGISLPATVTMVSLYFEKRRGLANSIAVSGGPVGGVIFASLITNLLESYGYQGCVLILAGFLFNGCVSGALFRPTSFYKVEKAKCKRNEDEYADEEENQELFINYKKQESSDMEIIIYGRDEVMPDRELLSSSDNAFNIAYGVSSDNCKSENGEQKPEDNSYKDIKCQETVKLYDNTEKAWSVNGVKSSVENIKTKRKDGGNLNMRIFISKYCDLELLRNPIFLAFLFQGSLIASGTLVAPIFLIPYARDIGISSKDLATLVTSQSCIDLFARLLIGYISDKNWLRRSNIVAIASMIVALSSSFLRFYSTFPILLGYSVVLGLVSGVYFSLYTVVLIDYLTLKNFQTSLGFMSLVHGFSIAAVFYLVGYLRDITGSYAVPYQVIGATTGFGAIILFMLPVIERLQKKSKH